ncbi:MAG: ATP-binding protein [Rhodobacteraceae bacterium]|jgi:serine/threonine-protein kinase RsbW|uniref:Serine/threonine-protein kinase RsbW n=1 Tax=Salipiger profundus TaxID=1229727 RepID=A0A1U7D7K8_9RHOB|nr:MULTISPECIES: ATP-binding protein [Salipiger]APX24103.1 serine/threonine-protein kinase RsbW [Salipiger profundus]MAB06893.1 ATP-binding protein [Paracoccaceae bacterium]GFZ94660.1 hypothetical protein GCM10011326_01820 [Salipiger profundus]SFB91027.1 serine/threonine-protein kinase RsbW [Salipiger profundus]
MPIVLEMQPSLDRIDPLVLSLKKEFENLLSEEKLGSMEIALAEALANAVTHGTSAGQSEPIRVTASDSAAGVTVEIVDAGKQVPRELYENVAALEDVDPLAENGRGLPLIRFLTDDLVFEHRDGQNRLQLLFARDPSA